MRKLLRSLDFKNGKTTLIGTTDAVMFVSEGMFGQFNL